MSLPRICFTSAHAVQLLLDGDRPEVRPGGLVIRNRATVISPGTELACLAGHESSWFRFPKVPGYCAVGVVEAIDGEAGGWKVGDEVVHYGGHQQWQAADPASDFLCRVPAGVAPEHAAFVHLATIAMTAVRQSTIHLGDDVAVTGLGLIGNLAAQLAALQGGRVMALDPDACKVGLAQRCGLAGAVQGTCVTAVAQARSWLQGRGFSTLIEATGRSATMVEALPLLGRFAEVVLLGTPRAACAMDLTAVLREFHLADRALTLKPAHEWLRPVAADPFVKHSFARDSRIVLELIAAGQLHVDELITHRLKPDAAPAAYRALAQGGAGYGGVVIDWT